MKTMAMIFFIASTSAFAGPGSVKASKIVCHAGDKSGVVKMRLLANHKNEKTAFFYGESSDHAFSADVLLDEKTYNATIDFAKGSIPNARAKGLSLDKSENGQGRTRLHVADSYVECFYEK